MKVNGFTRRLNTMGYANYQAYLASSHWHKVKQAYRQSKLPQHCLSCNSPNFQLHHREYKRLGRESIHDLLPLCSDCHSRVHEWHKNTNIKLRNTHKIIQRMNGWSWGKLKSQMQGIKLRVKEKPRKIDIAILAQKAETESIKRRIADREKLLTQI